MAAHDMLEVAAHGSRPAGKARRLVVTWQHPNERRIEPIGFLSHDEGGLYQFAYIRNAFTVKDFRPLLGFSDLREVYSSPDLFPLFAQRVMDPRRPDYQRYVKQLGLSEEEATPWEQITRSQGRRQGDTIQLLPVPVTDGDTLACFFLVHGVRWVPFKARILDGRRIEVTSEQVEQALGHLRDGDALGLSPEPQNEFNSLAIMVTGPSVTPVGWVPNLMVEDLHHLMVRAGVDVTVAKVNGPDAPWHMRLLARLTARPAGDFRFFTGRQWEPIAAGSPQ